MSDRNISRIRTALPHAWGAVFVFLVARTGWVIDDASADLVLVAVVPAAGAVVYETARTLESHENGLSRLVARLLLGSLRTPTYDPNDGPPPIW
jgi:hypothetical protein